MSEENKAIVPSQEPERTEGSNFIYNFINIYIIFS